MERAVAVKKLGKLLGKKFGYRVDTSAPTQEERDEAKESSKVLLAAKNAAKEAMMSRREALLAADGEYQQLVAAWKAADVAYSKEYSKQHCFRFTVGTMDSMFFHVKAQGDSWEEVIEKIEKENEARSQHLTRHGVT